MVKVKSHADDEDFANGLSPSWAMANEVADVLATWACGNLQLGNDEVTKVTWYDAAARATLRRGIAVIRRGIVVEDAPGSRKLIPNGPA